MIPWTHADRPPTRGCTRRARAVVLATTCSGLLLAATFPGPILAQSRSGTEPTPDERQPTVVALAAKKPKKMPQAKRAKIKNAKIKKAREFEAVSGEAEELVSTTDYDESGNARERTHRPSPGSTLDETLEVDLTRDVITKTKVRSIVEVRIGDQSQTVSDSSETDFAYDEVDFEDGKDYLLKTLEMKRHGNSLARVDHTYDGNGRLHQLIQNQAAEPGQPVSKRATTEFTYDAEDRPVMVVTYDHPNGGPGQDRAVSRQKREYGSNGQLSRIENLAPDAGSLPPGTDSLLSYSEYTYDSNLNLLTQKTWQRIAGASGPEDVLVLDERHVYDADGNEIETTVVLPAPPAGPPDPNGVPPSAYRASKSKKTTRSFDTFGNVLTELTIETDPDGTELSRRNRRIVYDKFD